LEEEKHDHEVQEGDEWANDETCAGRAQNAIAHYLSCAQRDVRLALGALLHVLDKHADALNGEESRGANQLAGMLHLIDGGMDNLQSQQQHAQILELQPADLMNAIFGGNIHHDG
jgi:hypothetical protein